MTRRAVEESVAATRSCVKEARGDWRAIQRYSTTLVQLAALVSAWAPMAAPSGATSDPLREDRRFHQIARQVGVA